MAEIMEYVSRSLHQEPDALEIIPQHPDYVIIGTYNLHRKGVEESGELSDPKTKRSGSLQVLLFTDDSSIANPSTASIFGSKEFDCAIVDLHFHPVFQWLLGTATSTGEIRFFKISINEGDIQEDQLFDIVELGILQVSEAEDAGDPPLITYFEWIADQHPSSDQENHDTILVTLAACDTNGGSKIIRTRLPMKPDNDKCLQTSTDNLSHQIRNVHKQQHNLEAWYLTSIPCTPTSSETEGSPYMLLSGGDDANLLASKYTLSTVIAEENDDESLSTFPPTRLFTMKNKHDAGIVSILALPLPFSDRHNNSGSDTSPIPLMTGSYDDHLRLFMLDCDPQKQSPRGPDCVTSIDLAGGVWRISLLDHYRHTSNHSTKAPKFPQVNDENENRSERYSYILLICNMYDGAKIVRLSASMNPSTAIPSNTNANTTSTTDHQATNSTIQWSIGIEAIFKKGHESMVYAAVARLKERNQTSKGRTWQILTSSFYDRALCNWEWTDGERVEK